MPPPEAPVPTIGSARKVMLGRHETTGDDCVVVASACCERSRFGFGRSPAAMRSETLAVLLNVTSPKARVTYRRRHDAAKDREDRGDGKGGLGVHKRVVIAVCCCYCCAAHLKRTANTVIEDETAGLAHTLFL